MSKSFIVKEGYPFILIPLCIGALLMGIGIFWMGILFILTSIFCAYFFRDPARIIPDGEKSVIAPADGKVIEISKENGGSQIKIFMSVLNVHVQRAPVSGVISAVEYKPGKFLHAMSPNACVENEQNIITIAVDGENFKVKQIAGVLARRIVCWVKLGDKVQKGDKIGMIRFGSQVDIFVPESVKIMVKPGQKTIGGKTLIGSLKK
ncbi:MAG: phosphatidylserine decarboxylase family protein [Endomicrobiaceae bacterium]|nr:phosphatidylserine decarboxylase family protein [Endomicrobiaceae bacterium]